MGLVDVLRGYFASVDNAGFVWQCHGLDWARCPGTAPGTCAEHRVNTSIAGGECEPFTKPTNSGPCEACSGLDIGLLLVAQAVALALLRCVYWVVAHENRAKSQKLVVLVGIVGSQFVTVFQMVGVTGSLSVVWQQPLATAVELGSVMHFRFEFLNLDCVVLASAVQRHAGTLFSFVALILCMVVFHYTYVLLFHHQRFLRGEFNEFRSEPVLVLLRALLS